MEKIFDRIFDKIIILLRLAGLSEMKFKQSPELLIEDNTYFQSNKFYRNKKPH